MGYEYNAHTLNEQQGTKAARQSPYTLIVSGSFVVNLKRNFIEK